MLKLKVAIPECDIAVQHVNLCEEMGDFTIECTIRICKCGCDAPFIPSKDWHLFLSAKHQKQWNNRNRYRKPDPQ